MSDVPRPRPSVSQPGQQGRPGQPGVRVMTATRAAPLPKEAPKGDLTSRLKEGAADTALNAASVMKEQFQELVGRDKSFKYKVLIIAVWALLSLAGVYVGWPQSAVRTDASL